MFKHFMLSQVYCIDLRCLVKWDPEHYVVKVCSVNMLPHEEVIF